VGLAAESRPARVQCARPAAARALKKYSINTDIYIYMFTLKFIHASVQKGTAFPWMVNSTAAKVNL
jgi:hypothetical protein